MPEVEFSISKICQYMDNKSTMGIIAKRVRYGNMPGPDFYSEVLHLDEAQVAGALSRIFDLAQEMANDLDVPVYAASVSFSGGISKMIRPEKSE